MPSAVPPSSGARRCTWLYEGGQICDQPLPAGELFCPGHPGAPHQLVVAVDPDPPRPVEFVDALPPALPDGRRVHAREQEIINPHPVDTAGEVERINPMYQPEVIRYISPDVTEVPQRIMQGRLRGELEATYYNSLCEINMQGSPDGMLVQYLARQLDDGLSGTAIAGVAARLMMAADKVFAGRPPTADSIDELQNRRQQRVVND